MAACLASTDFAQGLFDFLFGKPPNTAVAARTSRPPDARRTPFVAVVVPIKPAFCVQRRTAIYYVRLCDGRYYPLQRCRQATPAQMCSALCPATQTKVLLGREIDGAAALDGTRYSALEKAFLYRDRVIPECTCRPPLGCGRSTQPTIPLARRGRRSDRACGDGIQGQVCAKQRLLCRCC
jgi:Protein of unknown function (DUF2865)